MKGNNKKQTSTIVRTIRNIFVNGFNEFFSNFKHNKVKQLIEENKWIIIISTIVALFIMKNFFTIFSYNIEIAKASSEIETQTGINNQLKEDLEYYKTDEFILRYALEELNLRPTKDSDIYHGEILPEKENNDEQEGSEDNNSVETETNEDGSLKSEEVSSETSTVEDNNDNSESTKEEDSEDGPLQP